FGSSPSGMKSTPPIMNWISRAPANSAASPDRSSLEVLNVKSTPAFRSASARAASLSSVRYTTALTPARASATIALRFSLSSKATTSGGRLNSMHPQDYRDSARVFAASFENMSMTSPTWRALGQVVLVYFAVGGAAVTAQDTQPGRATFAEMLAFARLASVPCQRLAPDADSFYALALRRLIQPPITEEEIAAKKKTCFEFVSGFADGANAIPD